MSVEITEVQEAENFVLRHKFIYDTGNAILKELFPLTKDEMKSKIDSICGDKLPKNFIKNCHVIKTIEDDLPKQIELGMLNCQLIITWYGIELTENIKSKVLIRFDEHFKL